MIPLFHPRSIMLLSIGLVLGILAGLIYWQVGPFNLQAGWPPISRPDSSPVYESTAVVEVSPASAQYVDARARSRQAYYWETRLNKPEFFVYLSDQIAILSPDNTHTPVELARMVRTRFDGSSPYFEVKATSGISEEALFLANTTTRVFRDYLVLEEREALHDEYESNMRRLETLKADLPAAVDYLNSLSFNGNVTAPQQNPEYISATARVDALQTQLTALSLSLASAISVGAGGDEQLRINEQIETISEELASARINLARLEIEIEARNAALDALNAEYLIASAQVEAYRSQLRSLSSTLVALAMAETEEPAVLVSYVTTEAVDATLVPVEKPRGRNTLAIAGVLGAGCAWLGLNFKGLVRQGRKYLRNTPSSLDEVDDEDEGEKEDEA